jgi:hypothetical protein
MTPAMTPTKTNLCHPESISKLEAAPLWLVDEAEAEAGTELERVAGRPPEKD